MIEESIDFNNEVVTPINRDLDIHEKIIKRFPEFKKFKFLKRVHRSIDIKKVYKKFSKEKTFKILDINGYPDYFIVIKPNFGIVNTERGLFIYYNNVRVFNKLIKTPGGIIDPGYYEISSHPVTDELSYKSIDVFDVPTLILSYGIEKDIIKDINYFFKNKDFYKRNKIPYKRGLLLYGPPGNGKTTLIRKIMKNNKNYSFFIRSNTTMNQEVINYINDITNDKQKIIIMEDIDKLNSYETSLLLNLLDGVINNFNFYIIATCNDITKVDPAFVNRPSRFDKIFTIDYPDDDQKMKLLKFYFNDISDKELNECISMTKKFSCAYFKEIFIESQISKIPPRQVIENILNRNKVIKNIHENSYLG